ncbi:MAG TPA: macro domain-containing protein [Kofleriaceae bacterium]|nr:macro domain-containing protein [Kofleriaceae bacterium]
MEAGLPALVNEVRARAIGSIAVPALGCGIGGLAWDDVRPRNETALGALPEVRVLVFPPG